MIKARGPTHPLRFLFGSGFFSNLLNRVIKNAAVFPVPVCAWPATSFPAREMGKAALCMGVQYLKSASLMPSKTSLGRGRDSNVLSSNGFSR